MDQARLDALRETIRAGALLFGDHARRQMARHGIRGAELEAALAAPGTEMIEDYPADVRGPCCLVLSWIHGRAVHAVITSPPLPFVITAYWPDSQPRKWAHDFRRRI